MSFWEKVRSLFGGTTLSTQTPNEEYLMMMSRIRAATKIGTIIVQTRKGVWFGVGNKTYFFPKGTDPSGISGMKDLLPFTPTKANGLPPFESHYPSLDEDNNELPKKVYEPAWRWASAAKSASHQDSR